MYIKLTRRNIFIALAFLCLIIFLIIAKLNARPTVTISSSGPYKLELDDRLYAVDSKNKKFVLSGTAVNYKAVDQNGTTLSGVVRTAEESHSKLDLNFDTYNLAAVFKQVCKDKESEAIFCQKAQKDLKTEFIANNTWVVVTSEDGYAEAVRLSDEKKWQYVPISRSDINSGQYPTGLERAARENE
jgi:hypothetical protein